MQLQRALCIDLWRGDLINNGLKQWRHICRHIVVVFSCHTINSRSENHRKIELLLGRTQGVKEIKNLVHHPIGPRPRPINFIDHHNGFETPLERF